MTLNDLPPPNTTRWVVRRKAQVVFGASNCTVSVICFRLPSSFGNADASDQPFYQQHSVAITTAVLVAVVVVLGVAVYRPWKKQPAEVAIG